MPLEAFGLEQRLRLHLHDIRDIPVGHALEPRVVEGRDVRVIGTRERDPVLGLDEVAAELGEDRLALEVGILLRDREERRRDGDDPAAGRLRAKSGDERLYGGFVRTEALHAGDQRRNQVGAALELYVDERRGLPDAVAQAGDAIEDHPDPAGAGGESVKEDPDEQPERRDVRPGCGHQDRAEAAGESGAEEVPHDVGRGLAVTDLLRLARGDDEHVRLVLVLDLGGDDVRPFAGAAADEERRADDESVFGEAALAGRTFDGVGRAFFVIERIALVDVAVEDRKRVEVGALRIDPDVAGLVLDIEAARLPARGDGVAAGIDHRAGARAALVVGIGLLPGATPMFADRPTVEHAGLLGEVTDEGIATDAHPFEFDLADEDAEGLRDRRVVEQATFPAGVQRQQQATRGTR